MLRVGLTGGYATGKSFVARQLARLGCKLIYADELGHEVLLPEGAAYAPTIELFGRDILDDQGLIDRKKLAALVFDSPERLEQLTAIVHPAVYARERAILAEWEAQDPHAIAVTEAAILIETGRFRSFQKLILTNCDPAVQLQRGMARDGLTREQVEARIARQLPFEQKRAFASYIVDTSGTKEETARRVEEIYADLRKSGA